MRVPVVLGSAGNRAMGTLRLAVVLELVGAAAAVLATQSLRGAVLVSVTKDHGLDSGDLLVLPLLAVAATVAWPVFAARARSAGATGEPGRFALAMVPPGLALIALVAVRPAGGGAWGGGGRAALALVIASAGAAGALVALGPAGRRAGPELVRRALVPGAALVAGYLADTAFMPSGTVMGPLAFTLVMAWRRRRRPTHWVLLAAVLVAVDVVALADVAGLDVVAARGGGGPVRTVALGSVLAIGGLGDHLVGRTAVARERVKALDRP